ncbi:MAG: hypothetical protein EXR99_05900 [Gemmataceae bacterium]|nr:hypothetical protein [Gemmataceae bacterium]
MKKFLMVSGVLGTLAAGGVSLALIFKQANAQEQSRVAQAGSARAAEILGQHQAIEKSSMPLTQLVLFSSGVGYFQREGEVEGNARVNLRVWAGDVNDLLKSLVLEDKGGGRSSAVSYDGQDPVEKTLRSFALDLTMNPTVGQLLQQARGEKVEVTTGTGAGTTVTGTILGMESQMQPVGKDAVVETHQLNLVCQDGLRGVKLADVQKLKFLNPVLNEELRRALDVVAATHDQMKKSVSLTFNGKGKRQVKVGYVSENPIWKSSYRLSLNGNGKGRLQGWATIENTTDEDWKDLRLVLVSGRPISFQMDIYPPLFVPRPTIEPEKFAMLRPPTYNGAMAPGSVAPPVAGLNPGWTGLNLGGMANPGNWANNSLAAWGQGQMGGGGFGGQLGQMGGANFSNNRYQQVPTGNAMNFQNSAIPNQDNAGQQQRQAGEGGQQLMQQQLNLDNGRNLGKLSYQDLQNRKQDQVRQRELEMKGAIQKGQKIAMNSDQHLAAEAAEEAGEAYQYVVEEKISLARQKSALIQIIDQEITVSPFSLFNESVHGKFPLMGLRVKNSTNLPLPQGPVTVYENGSYGGDARLPDMQPGEDRFISYAVDLGMEVKTTVKMTTGPEITARFVGDSAQVHYTTRQTKTYHLKNRAKTDRQAVIEHPIRETWSLAGGMKTLEQSRDLYRFQTNAILGKTTTFDIPEEQPKTEPLPMRPVTDGKKPMLLATPLPLEVEFQLFIQTKPADLKNLVISKGVVSVTQEFQETRTYKFISRSAIDRKVTLEHTVRPDWKLLEAGAKPVAGSNSTYRFPLEVAKDKSVEKVIDETRTQVIQEKISAMDDNRVKGFLAHKTVGREVKNALQKTLDVRAALVDTKRKLVEKEKELKGISDDQTRLRSNLDKVPPTSAAYKRYLDKFDKQETQIEGLQDDIRKLQVDEKNQQMIVEEVLSGISAE